TTIRSIADSSTSRSRRTACISRSKNCGDQRAVQWRCESHDLTRPRVRKRDPLRAGELSDGDDRGQVALTPTGRTPSPAREGSERGSEPRLDAAAGRTGASAPPYRTCARSGGPEFDSGRPT